MKPPSDLQPRDRFLFWRTDFVGVAMIVSGALLLGVNFGLVPAASFLLPRVLGVLFIVAGLVFLFFSGAGGWMSWFVIPAGVLHTCGVVMIVLGSRMLLSRFAGALTALGLGLTFIAVFLTRRNHWWALIPAGAFIGCAAWLPLGARFPVVGWHPVPVVLLVGCSFIAIWLSSVQKRRMRWSLLVGSIISLAAALYLLGLLLIRWIALWPILLVLAGVLVPVVIVLLDRRRSGGPA